MVKSGKLWSSIIGKPNSGQSEERKICEAQLTENPVVVKSEELWSSINGKPNSGQSEERKILWSSINGKPNSGQSEERKICEAQLTENPVVVKSNKNCEAQLTENPVVVKSEKLWSSTDGKPISGQKVKNSPFSILRRNQVGQVNQMLRN